MGSYITIPIRKSNDDERSIAVDSGIPEELMHRESCLSEVDAQILMSEVIGTRAHSLTSLHICCSFEKLHIPLLKLFTNQLQILRIYSNKLKFVEGVLKYKMKMARTKPRTSNLMLTL
jgi:hypothetical protein